MNAIDLVDILFNHTNWNIYHYLDVAVPYSRSLDILAQLMHGGNEKLNLCRFSNVEFVNLIKCNSFGRGRIQKLKNLCKVNPSCAVATEIRS